MGLAKPRASYQNQARNVAFANNALFILGPDRKDGAIARRSDFQNALICPESNRNTGLASLEGFATVAQKKPTHPIHQFCQS